MSKLRDIEYTDRWLKKYAMRQEKAVIEITIIMNQMIKIEGNVIYNWKFINEIEDIYTMKFEFHKVRTASKKPQIAYYQLQKDANGHPILIRIPNDLTNEEKN